MSQNNAINTPLPVPIASGGTAASTASSALSNLGGLPIAGGTMTGNLILNADPTVPLGAVTKEYADAIGAGLTFKDACYAATTANLNATYVNGVSGVGATLVNAGSLAAFSVDGTSPALNARILVKNQTTASQNGIYTVTTIGTGVIAWVLTRSTDYNSPSEIAPGNFILVDNGTTNANTGWIQTATVTTIGTSSILFSQFGNAAALTASYILQTSNSALPNAQVLGSLSTGLIKNTTSTGVLVVGVAGTDYYSPGNPTTLIESAGNVFISNTSAPSFSSGTSNLGIGPISLFSLTSGSYNTAIGAGAGANMTSGSFNTFLGLNAGGGSASYTQCVFIGEAADASVNNLTNAISIGQGAIVPTSNTIVLGNISVTTCSIPGINLNFTANTLSSTNTNGNITLDPNGTGIISLSAHVGIDTTSPLAGCHVIGGVQNVTLEDTCFRAESTSHCAKIEFNCTATGGRLYELRSTNTGTFDVVDRTGSAERLVVSTTGVGIFGSADTNFSVTTGTADKPGGGTWASFSDRRIKDVLSNYTHGLTQILKINPVIYKYSEASQLREEDQEIVRIGIVAQDIEEVMPECVSQMKAKGFDDLRLYDESPLTYAIINAIQELNEKIESLKGKIR